MHIRYWSLYLLFSIFLLSCSGTKEITDGPTAYKLKKYELATRLLKADYEKAEGAEKAEFAWQIAKSYEAIGRPGEAAEWYKSAQEQGIARDAQFAYAKMLMADGQYDKAQNIFEAILKAEPYRRAEMREWMEACEQAQEWMAAELLTKVTPLSTLNSGAADFSLTRYGKNQWVFVSSRPAATGEEPDQWTGNAFYDLFVANRIDETTFEDIIPFDDQINGPYNDGPAAFNSSYTEMVFTQCGSDDMMVNDYCQLYYSRKAPEGGWSEPEALYLFEDSVNIGQPTWAPDDNTIVFAAVEPQGYGGSDLYYSVRTFEGWSPAINLGKPVNTSGDETFPWLDKNGQLFFSSNGHPGIGGLDLFTSPKTDRNRWGSPENLGYPINSSGDDFGVTILPLSEQEAIQYEIKGYLSSSRPGGKGLDDMYHFVRSKPPAQYFLAVTIEEKELAEPNNPQSDVIGYQPIAGAQLVIRSNERNDTVYVDTAGQYLTEVPANTDFTLYASNGPDYFSTSKTTTTKGYNALPGESVTVEVDIVLDRIFKEQEIVIPNIYYDFNDWAIRPDAADVLDSTIYKLLVDNPNIVIELGSHTDSRGSDKFNLELSQKRAQSVVDYLANKGIAPERLEAKGYGETQLVNECDDGVECTEEEHQRNRRTTFRVLSSDFEATSVEPDNILVDPKD